MEVKILKGHTDFDFIEQIIEFDKFNMKSVLDSAEIEFPEERRRQSFKSNPTFIVGLKEREIVGYLEFTRSWRDANYIYISSMQIDRKYRNTKLVLRLMDEFRILTEQEKFVGFETNVQKNNLQVIKLYRKIGFKFEENPNNPASWQLTADRSILQNSPIVSLIEKWRKKNL